MIVVVSAGNGGPDLATIEDLGSIPSAISVGASDSDRTSRRRVTVPGAGPYVAFTSTSALPGQPISAPLVDFNQIAAGGSLCNPAAGRQRGRPHSDRRGREPASSRRRSIMRMPQAPPP